VAERLEPGDDLELAGWHLEAMYELDEAGDLRSVPGTGNPEPPLVHLVTTRDGNLWRFHARLPAPVRALLAPLLAGEPRLDRSGAPGCFAAVRRALEQAGYSVDSAYSGPAFVLPRTPTRADGVVELTAANEGLMAQFFDGPWPDFEASRPMFAVEVDGAAVSLCFVARPSPGRAVAAGVRTIEAFQRRGYAKRVVAAWASAVYGQGRLPLYSTWWENEASRAVAAGLGGRWWGVDAHWSSAVMLA